MCFACTYPCLSGIQGCQKRVSDPLELKSGGCELPRGCWVPGPLEEHPVPEPQSHLSSPDAYSVLPQQQNSN